MDIINSTSQLDLDLPSVNTALRDASPEAVVAWAIGLQQRTIVTTSMGINAAAMLHLAVTQAPNIPVIWIDSGFNLRDTYRVAEELIDELGLNIHVYSPRITPERISARLGGIPTPEDAERHRWFTEQVKLEPFRRALEQWQPSLWLTGIRQEETPHRRELDIVTRDHRGMIKVAPFFYATEHDVAAYMTKHTLRSCRHYFDPTKGDNQRECGLHTAS